MSKKNVNAREAARAAHEAQLKAEKRRSRITLWTIIAIIVIVILVVVSLFWFRASQQEVDETGAAPAVANAEGGISLGATETGQGDEIDINDVGEAMEFSSQDEQPTEVPGSEDDQIIIYADPNCVHCAAFEGDNQELLGQYADDGVDIEYRLLNYLDNPGTNNYSSRASAALVCVADQSPEDFDAAIGAVMAQYDIHQGQGMKNDELVDVISEATDVDVSDCVSDRTYRPFVNYTSAKAREAGIRGTPSIWVNGKNWATEGADMSFPEFAEQELGK